MCEKRVHLNLEFVWCVLKKYYNLQSRYFC